MGNYCVDCNQEFELTDGEKAFFQGKGFDLPKRCVACRKKRKLKRQQEEGENSSTPWK